MIKFNATETVTDYLNNLQNTMDSSKTFLLEEMGEVLREAINDNKLPRDTGELLESVYDEENTTISVNDLVSKLTIKVTGEENPSRWWEFVTDEGMFLDYALYQETTLYYGDQNPSGLTPPKNPFFVKKTVEKVGDKMIGSTLKKELNQILQGGRI